MASVTKPPGFHYVQATYVSEYATRLTRYTHDHGAKNEVIVMQTDSSDGHEERQERQERQERPLFVDVTDTVTFEAALQRYALDDDHERTYVFGPPELAGHPLCVRVHHPEQQYLDLIRDVCDNGSRRMDRTKAGTYSVFDRDVRFDLRDGSVPILTTKRVFVRGVIEELLWMISGSTDAGALSGKGIRIWEGNSSRSFLDSIGMYHRAVGDLGPVYGFQWRHAGASYIDKDADYTGSGVDQLDTVIEGLRHDPFSRRHVMSAWQASDLGAMALPPCHSVACQFYVTQEGELSCSMYQRSCDVALGLPFNIASYALLTHMLAQVCNLKPGDLSIKIGDCHVYLPHVPIVRDQCIRSPRAFPTVCLNSMVSEIDDFAASDIVVEGYDPQSSLPMKMY